MSCPHGRAAQTADLDAGIMEPMFRRRKRPVAASFDERLEALRQAGLETRTEAAGRVRVTRGELAATIEEAPGAAPRIVLTGRLLGGELARLVDGGFQKFWRTPEGRSVPALADQLEGLHGFEEDLREALGLASYYNTSLGSTNALHRYDRPAPPSSS